jgi:hypothetical protein
MNRLGNHHIARIRWLPLIVVLSCLVLWIGSDASAQNTRPCADDIAKFCKDVKPGGGGLVNCLKQHESELSPVCKDHIAQTGKRTNEMQACKGDVDKFCKDIKPGGGRIVRCLKEHANELSPGCKESISQARKK